jgi:hypothetical protein
MYKCQLHSYTVLPFKIAGFLWSTICEQTNMQSAILCPMLSRHWIVNIPTTAISSCICPKSIPSGGNIWLFPKISRQRFFLEGCSQYSFDTFDSVQRFRFKNQARYSCKVKPIYSRRTITIVFFHSNMVIGVGTDAYQRWYLEIACQHNHWKCVCKNWLMLGKPNTKQRQAQNNTYTLSRNVGTINISYNKMELILL